MNAYLHLFCPTEKILPWLTKDIIQLMQKRNNLFRKAKDSSDPKDLQQFKATRNEVVSKLRISQQRFFSSLNPKCPKDFWKSIKALTTSPDDCSIPCLIDSETSYEVKDNGDKAELLNHYLSVTSIPCKCPSITLISHQSI